MIKVLRYEIEDNQGKLLKTFETVHDLTVYADSLTEEQTLDVFVYAYMEDNTVLSITFDGDILN